MLEVVPFVHNDQIKFRHGTAYRLGYPCLELTLFPQVKELVREPGQFFPEVVTEPIPALHCRTERKAEARQPQEEVTSWVYGHLPHEFHETVACLHGPCRPMVNGYDAEVRVTHVVAGKVGELLDPLFLDVLPGCYHKNPEIRLVVAEQGKGAEGDIGLAHPDFIGEICDTVLPEDVVNRNCTGKLFPGSGTMADAGPEVQKLFRRVYIDHDGSPLSMPDARRRNHLSNHSRKAGISPGLRATICSRILPASSS